MADALQPADSRRWRRGPDLLGCARARGPEDRIGPVGHQLVGDVRTGGPQGDLLLGDAQRPAEHTAATIDVALGEADAAELGGGELRGEAGRDRTPRSNAGVAGAVVSAGAGVVAGWPTVVVDPTVVVSDESSSPRVQLVAGRDEREGEGGDRGSAAEGWASQSRWNQSRSGGECGHTRSVDQGWRVRGPGRRGPSLKCRPS